MFSVKGTGIHHRKKHDIGDAKNHYGDIYDALVGALHALSASNVVVDAQTLAEAIDAAIKGMDWQENIISFRAMVTNEPGSPSDGDRYISTESGTIPSTTQAVNADDICEWDDTAGEWVIMPPEDGWAILEDGVDPNIAWWYNGSQWRKLGSIIDHSNLLNLTWSTAGHTIDTAVDMAGYKLVDNLHFGAYHISDTHGDDTNGDGSPGNPVKTVNQALTLWRASGEPHGSLILDVQSGTTYIATLQTGDDVSFTAEDGIWSNQVSEIEIVLANNTIITINNLTIPKIREANGQTGTSDVFIEDGWLGTITDYAETGYATNTRIALANTWINNVTTLTQLANCADVLVGTAFSDSSNKMHIYGNGVELMGAGINLNGYSVFHDDGTIRFAAGAYYNGTQWIAGTTEATVISISKSGNFQICYDNSLTPGNPFSPTIIFEIDDNGNIITVGTVDGIDISSHAADVDAHHTEDHASRHADGGADEVALAANQILPTALGTPTYDNLQELINNTISSGKIAGGGFTDNLDGTIDVAAGQGIIRATDNEITTALTFDWPAKSSLALSTGRNTIYVDYNSGTPEVKATTGTIDYNTEVPIGCVYWDGVAALLNEGGTTIQNLARRIHQYLRDVNNVERANGLIIGEVATRYVSMTTGVFYAGLNRKTAPAIDTSGADTFEYWYNNGSWQHSSQSQISNTQYNNYGVGLANLTVNKYGVHWLFMDYTGAIHVVYGVGDYTLAQAEATSIPANLPPLLTTCAVFLGRIICQQGAAVFTETQNAFVTTFTQTAATDHDDLANVTADQHHAEDHHLRHENGGADEIDVGGLSGVLADDQHVIDSEAQAAVNYGANITCAGATPAQSDFAGWSVGDRGMGIGSGGRVFFVYKDGASSIKYVELS